jgi:hypothetical protein
VSSLMEFIVKDGRGLVLYPEAIPTADAGLIVWQTRPWEAALQAPCRGCGEHFYLSEAELMEAAERGLPRQVTAPTYESLLRQLIRDMAVFCFRCKARRIAEGRAARGETLQ